jgi:hypothetical protein
MTLTYRKRRSFEAGHARKFLLMVDESTEFESALYYAAARVVRSSGTILMLYVIEPQDFQHWAGVRQVQIEEETLKARALFRLFRRKLNHVGFENIPCEERIRRGRARWSRCWPPARWRGRFRSRSRWCRATSRSTTSSHWLKVVPLSLAERP